MKSHRIVNKELLKSFHNRYCAVCNTRGSDPAHIKSVGSGGDDVEENVVPLCRACHQEQGKIGIVSFALKYPAFLMAIESKGWAINQFNKLVRDRETT